MNSHVALDPLQKQRVSARDIAYETLKKAILDGRLLPGAPIVPESLADQLQISRTPLREALQRLVADELVVHQTNGRMVVSSLSVEQVKELFGVRALLEGLVARQATENMTPAGLESLRRIVEAMRLSAEVGETEAVSLYGEDFHRQIYVLSRNRYATRLLGQLRDHIRRYRRIGPVANPERANVAAREHREMYELIVRGEAQEVEKAMRAHIENSLEVVVRSLCDARLSGGGSSV